MKTFIKFWSVVHAIWKYDKQRMQSQSWTRCYHICESSLLIRVCLKLLLINIFLVLNPLCLIYLYIIVFKTLTMCLFLCVNTNSLLGIALKQSIHVLNNHSKDHPKIPTVSPTNKTFVCGEGRGKGVKVCNFNKTIMMF